MFPIPPTTYPNGTPLKNWDNTYFGSMTVKSALALSRNIPAVKTLINVGLDNSSKFVNGLGITLDPLNTLMPSLVTLKMVEQVLKKMAAAYAAFSNGGIYTKLIMFPKLSSPMVVQLNTNRPLTSNASLNRLYHDQYSSKCFNIATF